MGKKFVSGPRYFLVAPKISVKKRGLPKAKVEIQKIEGLNEPETLVYKALTELKIVFETQVNKYGGATLGGAKLDFFLPDYNVDLEYNGPFHTTSAGKVRDLLRQITLIRDGIKLVTLDQFDLLRLKPAILEKIGVPITGIGIRGTFAT